MRRLAAALAFLTLVGAALPGAAFRLDKPLADPALEARARAVQESLRCLVCQNQSIAESDADLARDLRRIVRERIAAGDTDEEVVGYIVARYGDYVLLKPPLKPKTIALWFAPAILLLVGGFAVVRYLRRARTAAPAPAPLSDDEKRRIERLLAERDEP